MKPFSFNTARYIHHEQGAAARIAEIAENLVWQNEGGTRVLIVTDPGIINLGLHREAMASLQSANIAVELFTEVSADPPQTTVLKAVQQAKDQNITAVIGFGGGSSMDVAKLVALLAKSEQNLDDIYGVNLARGTRLPLILVPTTSGTGSEVTAISIVTTGESEKKGVVSPLLYPDLALLDADLTMGLPPHITAATGVDAMVHALEAYTSASPNNNPISQSLAKQALHLLGSNIREAVFNGKNNKEARSGMLLGSMLAGQAFANSPVAAVHALAYPIGGFFHVAHGLSNALVLPHVMEFNAPACTEQYAELAPVIFPEIDTSGGSQIVCSRFIEAMAGLTKDLGLETRLEQVGIKSEDLNRLAEFAMNQTRLLVNNPREVTLEDAYNIYSKAL
ncbi:MAG: iron-containing alcohol dehydrogenase [Methyloligellaceae bacterium]